VVFVPSVMFDGSVDSTGDMVASSSAFVKREKRRISVDAVVDVTEIGDATCGQFVPSVRTSITIIACR